MVRTGKNMDDPMDRPASEGPRAYDDAVEIMWMTLIILASFGVISLAVRRKR